MGLDKGLLLLAAAFASSAVILACSASSSDSEGDISDSGGTLPDVTVEEHEAGQDGSVSRPDAGGGDASDGGDGGPRDARAEAGDGGSEGGAIVDAPADVVYAAPGSPCSRDQEIQDRRCTLCGTESRLCGPDGDGGLVWQPWGGCLPKGNAVCEPGTTRTSACGLCGTKSELCDPTCQWTSAFCTEPPTAVCTPDASKFFPGLSCATGGRLRTCQADCTYGPASECFTPGAGDGGAPPGAITIAGTDVTGSNKVTVARTLQQGMTLPRLSAFSSCPLTGALGTATPGEHIVLYNADSVRTAHLSVWNHPATGGGEIDTIMAAYEGLAVEPVTVTERNACTVGVEDGCNASVANEPTACTGFATWSGLIYEPAVTGTGVTIPPQGSAVLYIAGYTTSDFGDYQLTVRTDALQ